MDIIVRRSPEIVTEIRGEEGHGIEAADEVLAKNASETLNKHYPGHLWAVHVNSEGGVMVIKNFRISFQYGMVLHLRNVYQDPTLKRVIRAGGELLERARMARGRANGEQATMLEGIEQRHEAVFKAGIIV